MIDQAVRCLPDHGYRVVLDGIFDADRYGLMLAALHRDHCGVSRFCYLDVSVDESLRRHATRPRAAGSGPDDMRQWHRRRDLLSTIREQVIPETATLQQAISTIVARTRLLQAQPCSPDDSNAGCTARPKPDQAGNCRPWPQSTWVAKPRALAHASRWPASAEAARQPKRHGEQ